jgi:hypothetical protein
MTIRAITGNTAVIESGPLPTRCDVAVITLLIAADMVWCFAARANAVVALFTLMGGADEDTVLMTLDALHFPMFTSQGKAGGKVIKTIGYGIQVVTLKSDP